MTHTGIVIIGRNEGERLVRCLASVAGQSRPVVYVDSGSTDRSVDAARAAGASVVDLDTSLPFSAARARNEGFSRLTQISPDVRFVQFVDGDCEVAPDWLDRAAVELDRRPELAAVCGTLRERFPDASIYNHLCDLEWNRGTGEIEACGGVAMYRADYFRDVDGFDPSVVAGEEPELCARLRAAGHKIVRLPDQMAWHDSAMHRFAQWWKRQVRGGYGGMDVAQRFERQRGGGSFTRQIRSAWFWTLGIPAAALAISVVAYILSGPVAAAGAALLTLALIPLQTARLIFKTFRKGLPARVALWHGCLTMVAKLAHIRGHLKYLHDKMSQRGLQIIEHKALA